MIPGSAAKTLSANLPNGCDKASYLFFIHSLAPAPFLPSPLVLPDAVVDTLGPPSRASIRPPRVIPKAVKIEMILF